MRSALRLVADVRLIFQLLRNLQLSCVTSVQPGSRHEHAREI